MDLFSKPPCIELLEFCLSANYLPESEEKQLHIMAALRAQTKSYVNRCVFSFIQVMVDNYALLSPKLVTQFFELLDEAGVRLNPTPGLDELLTICFLSEDASMNAVGDALLHRAFNKSALPSPRLQAAVTLRERKLHLVDGGASATFAALIQRFRGSNAGLRPLVEEIYGRCKDNTGNQQFVKAWAELCPKMGLLARCLGI